MEKDIALSGAQYSFEGKDTKALIDELAAVCQRFDRGSKLQNLLYRVDLKPSFDSVPDYKSLAVLLWDRAFQKVWFRKTYSREHLKK